MSKDDKGSFEAKGVEIVRRDNFIKLVNIMRKISEKLLIDRDLSWIK